MAESQAGKILEEKIGKKLVEKKEFIKSIGVPVSIELKGEGGGRWVIDCQASNPSITKDSKLAAVTTISMDVEVFEKMAKKELGPETAFLTGKVKVDGNLGVAIKLGQLLS